MVDWDSTGVRGERPGSIIIRGLVYALGKDFAGLLSKLNHGWLIHIHVLVTGVSANIAHFVAKSMHCLPNIPV